MRQADTYPVKSLTADIYTSDQNGASIDAGSDPICDAVEHVVSVGESDDTLSGSVYLTLELEHSDDGSTWADVTDADHVVDGLNSAFVASGTGIFKTIDDAAEDDIVVSIHYTGPKRYSRVVYNLTGTHTNGFPLAGAAIKSHLRKLPQ